jgi:hypothetical protein
MTEGNPFDVDGVWLKSAFHTHSARSDGELDPAAHVRHHEWMGFDVVAITDHWTLTHEPSTDHILVITGAELAADPYGGALADSEILAIGISDIPEDPGGDRAKWGPIDAYTYKTFPDLSAAAGCIADQGGVSFIAHPYWSGMPLDTLMAVEGAHGIELFNSSAQRENARGDSSYVWDLCLDRGKRFWAFGTDDCHYPGFDIGDAWTMVRAAERSEGAVLEALRQGHTYASAGPQIRDITVDGTELEVRCSPARAVVMASRYETGWAVMAGGRNRMEEARVLERDDRGFVVRARFSPSIELPHRRVVVEDETGRKAWSNPI